MKGRMRKFFFVTDDEGKKVLSWLRAALALVSAALVTVLISWFVWVTTQAYDVATNKSLIYETGDRLEKDIASNKDLINTNNGIHHMRESKIDDKYDAKITELQKLIIETNKLVVEILLEQKKDVELKKEEVKIQKKSLDVMQQQAR